MITREQVPRVSSPRILGLFLVLVPWVGAIVYNAWERRGEIADWLKSTT